ncbi:unknown [Candidatus Apopatosoma intestinale]|nr:unknown [Candidatus Apopatosoma intestinale]
MLMCGKLNEITIILFGVCLRSRAFVTVDSDSGRNCIKIIIYFYCIGKYFNACETATVIERTTSYACHTIRYIDTCEATAKKRIISYAHHSVRYFNTRKTTAAIECIIFYARHAIWYDIYSYVFFRGINN